MFKDSYTISLAPSLKLTKNNFLPKTINLFFTIFFPTDNKLSPKRIKVKHLHETPPSYKEKKLQCPFFCGAMLVYYTLIRFLLLQMLDITNVILGLK